MTAQDTGANNFGATLRRYRSTRRMSQLDLANACDISSKHLSFLESGRARPSREMVIHLGAVLMLPRDGRNAMMLAAGFAPVFPASPLNSEALEPFRSILGEMMERHAPYPAMLVDRHWTVLKANPAAHALLAVLQAGSDEMNLVRLITSGEHASTAIANLPEVLDELRSRLQLEALEAAHDPIFSELLIDLERALSRHPQSKPHVRRPIVPLLLNTPAGQLSFLSAIAHFGTSEDVTIRDLRLELLFPADDATRAVIQRLS